jgi:hypothetical protein
MTMHPDATACTWHKPPPPPRLRQPHLTCGHRLQMAHVAATTSSWHMPRPPPFHAPRRPVCSEDRRPNLRVRQEVRVPLPHACSLPLTHT